MGGTWRICGLFPRVPSAIRAIPREVQKSPPLSFKSSILHTGDTHWTGDEARRPDDPQFAFGGPAHPSPRDRLGRVSLIFDREALRASARLLHRLPPQYRLVTCPSEQPSVAPVSTPLPWRTTWSTNCDEHSSLDRDA